MSRTGGGLALGLAALLVPALLPAGAGGGQPAQVRELLAVGQAVEAVDPLVAIFAADSSSAEGTRLLWRIARTAPATPEFVDAVEAAADRLGPEGPLALGVLLRRAYRPLDALEVFDRAATLPHFSRSALPDIEAGRLLAELRSHELALTRFDRHPNDPRALHGSAVVLARLRRTEEAFAKTEALLGTDPENAAAILLQAELLDSVGRGSETLDALRRLAETTGPAGPAAFRLARILVRRGEVEEAVPILNAVLHEAPRNAEAWLALARAHESAGQNADATAAFERALEADPALNEARFALATRLARDQNPEAAQPLFDEFEARKAVAEESARLLGEAELHPEDDARVTVFVNHALTSGEFGLALRGAQRFLVDFPDRPERHLLLARVFREGGSRTDTERVLRRAQTRFADDPAAVRRFDAALYAIGAR